MQFSDYSELYDLIIPRDNLLRRINDLVDFSFIRKELMDKYSLDNGRMAESPIMLFKYLLLKTVYDISDVDVVERSRYDMSFKYFLGMSPEVSSSPALAEVPKIKERLNMLKEVFSDIEDHYVTSKDGDARVGHKSGDDSFFGYKTHIAMSDERIITAATVTSGEKGDGPQLGELVEQSRANGMAVDTVVGDTAYSGKDNIILSNDGDKGFELVAKLNPTISTGRRKEEDRFDYNKDAGMFVCPAGHMAVGKEVQRWKGPRKGQALVFYFDVGKCKVCSRRNGCYKEGAKSKSYSVRIKSDEHQRQADFEKTEEFKEKAKVRYKIEAKNAELKNVFGYDRADSYGLDCMRIQGAMAIFAANIKRILRLS